MDNSLKITAVVVTYNRKALLIECMNALFKQIHPLYRIIIIDNASTDGTYEAVQSAGLLKSNVEYVKMASNTGGSGGFYYGMKKSIEDPSDWVWIMDDDTIPEEDALQKLIEGYELICHRENKVDISFLASTVYGPEGEFMNVPTISSTPSSNGYPGWYAFLDKGIVSISRATFVSLLINKDAIVQCGLPCKDYFIWGDDYEYTMRLTRFYGPAYFIGNSKVLHKRFNAKSLDIRNEENEKRIEMYHYFYRNNLINKWFYEKRQSRLKALLIGIVEAKKIYSSQFGSQKAKAVLKGYCEAIRQFDKFKSYIESQIAIKKRPFD